MTAEKRISLCSAVAEKIVHIHPVALLRFRRSVNGRFEATFQLLFCVIPEEIIGPHVQ
jgi:hypothetical protein